MLWVAAKRLSTRALALSSVRDCLTAAAFMARRRAPGGSVHCEPLAPTMTDLTPCDSSALIPLTNTVYEDLGGMCNHGLRGKPRGNLSA
jgi:hypothetical protein